MTCFDVRYTECISDFLSTAHLNSPVTLIIMLLSEERLGADLAITSTVTEENVMYYIEEQASCVCICSSHL